MNRFDWETGKCLGTFPEHYLPPSELETQRHGDHSTEKERQMWRLFRSREYTGPKYTPPFLEGKQREGGGLTEGLNLLPL